MIPVVTVEQMRNIDSEAIHGDEAIGYEYMQRAARGIFETVQDHLPNTNCGDFMLSESITIVCGKGNNGGDGFLVAKMLADAGYNTRVFALFDKEQLKGEAKKAFEEYENASGQLSYIKEEEDLSEFVEYISKNCSLLIDAILGTGTNGDPRGLSSKLIEMINNTAVPVLSVDTPSGLNNDDGSPGIPCIHADSTVTMGFPKLGTFFYPGRASVGSLMIKDLNYPRDLLQHYEEAVFVPAMEDLRAMLPARRESGSKFDHGVALMICGSKGMTGAPVLSSMSTMRTGAGMVHMAAPESIIETLANQVREVVFHGIDETPNGRASLSALDECMNLAEMAQVLCLGPGISHDLETSALVKELVSSLDKPMILDADGLNAYKGCVEELKKHKGPLLITPHYGEWQRLFGPLPEKPLAKIAMLQAKAKEFNMIILLKGAPTIVVDPEGRAFILPYGNSGMATAGSGDVLAGIITGLAAQGSTLSDAAILASYLHGQSGDMAADELSEYSMIASDLLDYLPMAIKNLANL